MNEWPPTPTVLRHQVRYQLLAAVRSPVGMFFTIVLPLVMLVLFNALTGDGTVSTPDGEWPVRQFYTAGLAAFTAVSATYTNLVNVVPIRRDDGILKRWRSTPVAPWVHLMGWVSSAVIVAAGGVVLMLGAGLAFYGLHIDVAKVPGLVLTFVVGVASFAALGMAVAGLVPDADAAPAVANATILPLAFVSDVFIPLEDPPRWLEVLGDVFPLKPFVNAMQDLLNPLVDPPGIDWSRLGVVALWGVGGLLVATRTFRWEPATRAGRTGRSRRRQRRTAPAEA